MRRFLLFLLVFAAGLGVLLLVQESSRKQAPAGAPVAPGDGSADAAAPRVEETGPEVPQATSPLPTGDGQVRVGGEISIAKYDGPGGPLRYRLRAQDVRQVSEDSYDLLALEVEFHDPRTGALQTSLEAASATVRARFTEAGFEVEESHENVLSDVDVVLHTGTPLAPLRARLPQMGLRLEDQRLKSDGEVLVEGRGLQITGFGLLIERDRETLDIHREPRVRMRFEDGSRALLRARGGLHLAARGESGAEELELTASRAARLDFHTGSAARLEAETIRLVGAIERQAETAEEPEAEEARFVPHTVEALGGATVTTPDGVFEGERGELVFDAEGAIERAVLVGSPRLRLNLADLDLTDLGDIEPAEGDLPLEASGAGPLEIVLDEPALVNFSGPLELRMPSIDVVVRAETGASGTRDASNERFALSILGAVIVEHGESTLEAPELTIDSTPAPDGGRVGRLTSQGPTRTVGHLTGGQSFTLTTSGQLIVERDASGFRLPRAEGVDLDVRGDEPFTARADLVRDFEEEPIAFVAEGRPARFAFDDGWLEATQVELDGRELHAREGARVHYVVEGTSYDLSARWARLDRSGELEGEDVKGLVVLDAFGDVAVAVASDEGWTAEVVSDALRVKALEVFGPQGRQADELGTLEPAELLAEGNVLFAYSSEFDLNGVGERLRLRPDGSGELTPAIDAGSSERIRLEGRLPKDDSDFTMTCRRVEFSPERLIAEDPDLVMDQAEGADAAGRLRMVAGRLTSDRVSVLLTAGVHISQQASDDPAWMLYADKVLLTGAPSEDQDPTLESFRDLVAWGGFVASFGDEVKASGDTLQIIREQELVRIAGEPAMVEFSAFQWAAEWFALNLETGVVRAGPGEVRGAEATEESWIMTYASLEPVEEPGETIQVIREPVIRSRSEEVRASWALFWVDNSEWSRMSQRAMGQERGLGVPLPEASRRKPPHPDSLFGRIGSTPGTAWLREVYLEGNVAYSKRGFQVARADSIYLDLVDGHGWIRRIDLSVELPFMEDRQLKLRARWMRHSADGSFFASSAVATTCDHEEPHYVVRIGDLEIEPREVERPPRPGEGPDPIKKPDGWQISTRDTSLGLYNNFELPLPRIGVPVTPDLKLDAERLSLGGLHPLQFGSDSKLGTFIGTTISRDLGWIAKGLNRLLIGVDTPSVDLEGQTDYRASWNDDRGVLLGLSSELGVPGHYRLDVNVDGLFDRGSDKGLIRVPESERDDWRAWYRTRGRYILDDEEWFDLVISVQEDAAVQSEFFEGDFLDYEERESYLHWRQADGEDYFAATVEGYPNDFQTEVVAQEARHARGRTAVAGLTEEVPLLYSSGTSLTHLQRELGDPRFPSPFDERFLSTGFAAPGFATPAAGNTSDGWGEASALRLDTRHRLEAPVALGLAALRATPFLEAVGTAWQIEAEINEKTPSLSSAEDPTRFGLLGGVEVGTTVWRLFESGLRHSISPFVGFRQDLFVEEDEDPLVQFDRSENPIDGRFFDLGVRSRIESGLGGSFLDLELVGTYADDAAGGQPDGWLPVELDVGSLTELWGMGFGVNHDARYDLEGADQTPYSRTVVGLDPIPSLGIEVGYHSARDLGGQTLYNAFSSGARYQFSPKWELEGRYVFSTQGGGRLSSEFGVRRFGHDFVFEVQTRFREGEGGGSSIQFDVIPLLAYDEPGTSLVERWRQRRY